MAEKPSDLPDDCWELIFSFLSSNNSRYLEPLSLVSKRFLSITNRFFLSLAITEPILSLLPRIFFRFPRIKEIEIREFSGDLNDLLVQIARSGLDLETVDFSDQKEVPLRGLKELGSQMKNLRTLRCSKLSFLVDKDLEFIGDSCEFLKELDISYPENHYFMFSSFGHDESRRFWQALTDDGIVMLSMKLRQLEKINISGNPFITDKSVLALSANCLFLREVVVRECNFITLNGIGMAMPNMRNLNKVSIGTWFTSLNGSFADPFVNARGLCDVDISTSSVSDELLSSLAKAELSSLKKLSLSHSDGFTISGISAVLCKYQSLQYLDLEAASFLTDADINMFSEFLSKLNFVNLSYCSNLTWKSFFILTRNCPLLNEIKMKAINQSQVDSLIDFTLNTRIKYLDLGCNKRLTNNCLRRLLSVCPSLESLDVSHCSYITVECMVDIFRCCPNVKHLEMNYCGTKRNSDAVEESRIIDGLESSKLEVLLARGSAISDEGLEVIAKMCQRLAHLDLQSCVVTAQGVRKVVENCRGLKEINLGECNNVSKDIVTWMVFARRSLRKIIGPSGFLPSTSERNFFFRHGCVVTGKLPAFQRSRKEIGD